MDVRALVCFISVLMANCEAAVYSEDYLKEHIESAFELTASDLCHKSALASFNYFTDLLNATKEQIMITNKLKVSKFLKNEWEEFFRDAEWKHFRNPVLKRELYLLSVAGEAALNSTLVTKLNHHKSVMTKIYSTAKICPYRKQKCHLKNMLAFDPDIQALMWKSTDYDELAYVWKAWRDATGAKMRKDYKVYVDLMNVAAKANGFPDMGALWRDNFESDTFVQDIENLWRQVEPLYVALHSYVREKLVGRYGDRMGEEGVIPAHLLGDMWAQSWIHLYQLVVPYPAATSLDVTKVLKDKKYSVRRMFETANEFYVSLGLPSNEMSYNESLGAMITKPRGKEVVCHPSAWDLCNGVDFRIKMCTKINNEDFITIHHEMGHIAYYQQYPNLPFAFRASANPGFTEAIGDIIALSVSTPRHLERIGLLKDYVEDPHTDINALMKMALAKVAFLPFGLLIDEWRWDVFSGAVSEQQWNSHWWHLRETIQRVKAPVPRSELDFDPGAKYHIPGNSQYISYFISYILQFQVHRSLCITAGQYDPNDASRNPLYKCDIFRSKKAGSVLKAGLSMGTTRHWSEVLFVLTGQREISASALLEYFAPLTEFLKKRS